MENMKIVKVDIVDDPDDAGIGTLSRFYLVNPDRKKLAELRARVLSRYDEDGNSSINDIGDIEKEIRSNFDVIEIESFDIPW